MILADAEITYVMGIMGEDKCPGSSKAIYDEKECEIASSFVGLNYDRTRNDGQSDSICFYKRSESSTRVANNLGDNARWICKMSMHSISL